MWIGNLNLNLLGCFRQFVTELAQPLLEVSQGFPAKTINSEQRGLACFQHFHHLTNLGDISSGERICSSSSKFKFGDRSFRGNLFSFASFVLIDEFLPSLKFLVKSIYLTLGVDDALFTSKKGMAIRTNISMDFFNR